MGNTNSQSKSFLKDFPKDYSKLATLKHDALGDITLYQNKADRTTVFHKAYLAKSEQEHRYLTDVALKRNLLYHSHLLRLYAYKTTFQGNSCTALNKIETFSEFHQNTLHSEITQRQPNKQHLTEQDIILILYHLVQATKHLLDHQLHVEDIRPALVFMAPQVKLADRIINLGMQGSYMLAAKHQAKVLLAPEQIDLLQQKVAYPSYDASKTDIFQLGMTILLACTLSTIETFYEFPSYKLIYQSLENQLQKITNLYSPFLCRMVKLMVEKNPFDRPTIHDIYVFDLLILCKNVLNKYDSEIESGNPFEVDYLKLSQHLNS